MNKRGFDNQIMILIVLGIMVILFMGIIFIVAVAGPIVVDLVSGTNDIVQDLAISKPPPNAGNSNANFSEITQASFGNATEGVQQLQFLVYTLIIIMFLGFIAIAFYVRTYPFLIYIWILMIVVLAVFGLIITVAYQNIVDDNNYLAETVTSWKLTHFLMSSLPHIIVALGIVGGIIMFMLPSRDAESEAGVI